MPDGTGFFSAPQANNWFDVGEWNIYVNTLRRTGIVLFRIRDYSLVAGP